MQVIVRLCALAALAALGAVGAARAQGFTTFDNPGGGRVIAGTLPAADTTTRAALIDMLRRTHAYFGAKPEVTRLEQSPDGTSAIAYFKAAGKPGAVSGAVMAGTGPGATPFGALIFDTAGHFHQTLPVLLQKAESLRPASATQAAPTQATATQGAPAPAAATQAAGAAPPLTTQSFADGSGSVGIPPGWNLREGHEGTFATGPVNGPIYVMAGVPIFGPWQPGSFMATTLQRFHRPGAPPPLIVPYDATDPTRDLVAVFATVARLAHRSPDNFAVLKVLAQQKTGQMGMATTWKLDFLFRGLGGQTYHFLGLVNIRAPLGDGNWFINVARGFEAPADQFPTLVPTFVAVMKSLKLNKRVIMQEARAQQRANDQQFRSNQAAVQANQRAFQANLRANQQSYNQNFQRTEAGILRQQDASHAGARAFIRSIQGTTVMADPTTGQHYEAPASIAGALARQDPSHFKIVPLSQYIKGTDY